MKRTHDSSSAAEEPAAKQAKVGGDEDAFESRCVNAVRCLAADMPTRANSGHPGAPLGCAPMAHVLFTRHMRYSPADPHWYNRDRFVLSNGHASALQYAMLHVTGYDLSMHELEQFRQVGSRTPGHPERGYAAGVEVTTGPLGQGFANAVGMAIAQEHLAARFNRPGHVIVDNYVYVIMGDGCNMEGVALEAASLAGHLKLGRLIVLYDDNDITIDGGTNLAFSENVLARYEAYGWHTQRVVRGDSDLDGIDEAIALAKAETARPSLISVRTTIGFSSAKQGTAGVHGSPLSKDDLRNVKKALGMDPDKCFFVPDDVLARYRRQVDVGRALVAEWNGAVERYAAAFPAEAAEFVRRVEGRLPDGWKDALPKYSPGGKKATRSTSGEVLNALAKVMPELVGGSADLSPSTKTELACSRDFLPGQRDGRYIRYGVREHAMCAVNNGLHAYGGFIPFGATFLAFLTYCDASVRLAALVGHQALYIFTHDSIAVGEDGPTHQPTEVLQIARAHPNLQVVRPADGNETSGAYMVAIEKRDGPTLLSLTRQDLPQLEGTSRDGVAKGGYVLHRVEDPAIIIVASGSEVHLAVDAARALGNANVVSMPCTELFDAQPEEYRAQVLLPGVPVMSVELSSPMGWERYAHAHVCITGYGHSGPAEQLLEEYGFSVGNVVDKARVVVSKFKGKHVPCLTDRLVFSMEPSHPSHV